MNGKRAPGSGTFQRVVVWTVGIVAFAFLVAAMAEIFVRSSDEQAVKDTVDGFTEAIADNDGEQACTLLSREAQDELMRRKDASSCKRAAEQTGVRYASIYDFDAIIFGGDHKSALVRVALPDDMARDFGFPQIHLEHGDGRWTITDLDWYFNGSF